MWGFLGLGLDTVQSNLELYNLGYFKNTKAVIELGSQELHLKKDDLKEFFEYANIDSNLINKYPNINNWPGQPRCSSKYFYESLGFSEYKCIDINFNSSVNHQDNKNDYIIHDLNTPFKDKSQFNKFDLVTDYGTCEHIFNVSECYRTMHNLVKPGGYIMITQDVIKGHGFFLFDKPTFERIAAANNYKIINRSYVIPTDKITENGTGIAYHIPQSQALLNMLSFGKIKKVTIAITFQKQDDKDFKIPSLENQYQSKLGLMQGGDFNFGFNRMYFKDPLSYSLLPSSKISIQEISFKDLIKEFFKRLFKKIK